MVPWEDRFDEIRTKNEDVRRKMFIDAIREKNPAIDPGLVYLTPAEVIRAMESERRVREFSRRVIDDYSPPEGRVALLFPDVERKPWTRGSTEALAYRNLFASLKNLGLSDRIEVLTMSPVLGIVPERYFDSMPMYESSGLASFMVQRRGLAWSQEDFRTVIAKARDLSLEFMERFRGSFGSWHAVFRVPSIHQRLVQEIVEAKGYPIWTHPSKRSLAESYLDMKKIVGEVVK